MLEPVACHKPWPHLPHPNRTVIPDDGKPVSECPGVPNLAEPVWNLAQFDAEDLRRTLAALNVALYWAHPDTPEGRDEIAGCRVALEMGQAALERLRAPAERVQDGSTDTTGTPDLPEHLRGDGPCQDCGGDNIIWFTDNAFWNRVMGGLESRGDPGGIVCIPCFVKRVDTAGFAAHWRLVPDWHWETKTERAVRRAAEEAP